MADWVAIQDTAVDPDAPVTSELAYAWRDNVIAVTEGALGSPYEYAVWRPWDSAVWGDGGTGVIWDFAVHGGSPTIVTPDFEEGWDYRLLVDRIGGPFAPLGGNPIRIRFYDASWGSYINVGGNIVSSAGRGFGFINIFQPGSTGVTIRSHEAIIVDVGSLSNNGATNSTAGMTIWRRDGGLPVIRAELSSSTIGNFSTGRVVMMRRRTNGPVIRG